MDSATAEPPVPASAPKLRRNIEQSRYDRFKQGILRPSEIISSANRLLRTELGILQVQDRYKTPICFFMTPEEWDDIPTSMRSQLKLETHGTDYWASAYSGVINSIQPDEAKLLGQRKRSYYVISASKKSPLHGYITERFSMQNAPDLEPPAKPDAHVQRIDINRSTSLPQLSQGPYFLNALPHLDELKRAAATKAPILLCGERGTGKELIGQFVHSNSYRAKAPYVTVNCAALVGTLFESEVFGHVRGSFTGATRDKPGLFEIAHGGTIFLDEITEMPAEQQAKLLRVLQEREVMPVGGGSSRKFDVRIIAATNRDLRSAVKSGKLRLDLYDRLDQFRYQLPPLRETKQHLPALAAFLIPVIANEIFENGKAGTVRPKLAIDAIEKLIAHNWPGNIRELKSVLLRAMINQQNVITANDIVISNDVDLVIDESAYNFVSYAKQAIAAGHGPRLQHEFQSALLQAAMEMSGNVQRHAARLLGMSDRTINYKLNGPPTRKDSTPEI